MDLDLYFILFFNLSDLVHASACIPQFLCQQTNLLFFLLFRLDELDKMLSRFNFKGSGINKRQLEWYFLARDNQKWQMKNLGNHQIPLLLVPSRGRKVVNGVYLVLGITNF